MDSPIPSSVESVSLLSAQKELSNTCRGIIVIIGIIAHFHDGIIVIFAKIAKIVIIGKKIERHLAHTEHEHTEI